MDLMSLKGIRFKETILSDTIVNYGDSRDFLSSNGSPVPPKICAGPLVAFSFFEKGSDTERKQLLKSAVEENSRLRGGLLLVAREKGVAFPVVHVSENGHVMNGNPADEENSAVSRAVYEEVRNIMPETELPQVAPVPQTQEKIGYILLGFKSLDKNFSQVMVDTWKDWTGARYIYMYLPDDLGLRRISLYHRQFPDDMNLFTYLVLVECHGITSGEKLVQLLDFVQRIRLERLTGYVSVYTGDKFDLTFDTTSSSSSSSSHASHYNADFLPRRKNTGIADDIFSLNPVDRNSRK